MQLQSLHKFRCCVGVSTFLLALLCVAATARAQPQEMPAPWTPENPTHHIMLRTVLVYPTWARFTDGDDGWSAAVALKESDRLKYFEAAIWVEERVIHLYAFDNDFDPHGGLFGMTPEQYVAHRESYRVLRITGLPPFPPADESQAEQVSAFLREAFKDIASYLVQHYPDSQHHFIYHGHGAPGGRLIEYEMHYDDASEMLAHWTGELGRPLGVIDMGGPCSKGGYEDLTNFCQHARFYIASDMPNGGYEFDAGFGEFMDESDYEKFMAGNPELQYHRLFAETGNLFDALAQRVDLSRKYYEYSRHNMTKKRWMQATYLYDCQAFLSFSRRFVPFMNSLFPNPYHAIDIRAWEDRKTDLLEFLETNGAGPDLLEAFDTVIAHQANNRDFFAWPQSRNGILMPYVGWLWPALLWEADTATD